MIERVRQIQDWEVSELRSRGVRGAWKLYNSWLGVTAVWGCMSGTMGSVRVL